jgi:hypothetical protein
MRRLWAAGAAIVMCLALGGVPTAGQEAAEPASAAWVTGTGSIPVEVEAGTETQVGDVLQTRGLVFTDEMAMSDPRVSGAGTGTWNQDAYAGDVGISWGTYRLENKAGAWEGTFTSADGPVAASSGFLVGEGGYEGLTYYWHQDIGDEISVVGIIFPGDPPTP